MTEVENKKKRKVHEIASYSEWLESVAGCLQKYKHCEKALKQVFERHENVSDRSCAMSKIKRLYLEKYYKIPKSLKPEMEKISGWSAWGRELMQQNPLQIILKQKAIKLRHKVPLSARELPTKNQRLVKAIEDLQIYPSKLYCWKLSKQDVETLELKARTALEKKLARPNTITNPQKYLTQAVEILKEENWTDHQLPSVILALLLVTGRRTVEICKTAKFELVEGEEKTLAFEGQAKQTLREKAFKGDAEQGEKGKKRTIQTLANAALVKHAFDEVRKSLAQKTFQFQVKNEAGEINAVPFVGTSALSNAQVNSKWGQPLKRRLAKLFPQVKRVHELRSLYNAILYEENAKETGEKPNFTYFTQKALCHTSMDASLHYGALNLAFDPDFVEPEPKKKKIKGEGGGRCVVKTEIV